MLTLLKRNKRRHFRRKSKKENRLTKRRRWEDGFTGAEVKLCFFQRLLLLEGKVIRRDWCVRLCLYKQWNYLIIMRCGINMHALSFQQKKKKMHALIFFFFQSALRSVWYMCLKTKNCCLKIFVEIRVSEKMYRNAWNVV